MDEGDFGNFSPLVILRIHTYTHTGVTRARGILITLNGIKKIDFLSN